MNTITERSLCPGITSRYAGNQSRAIQEHALLLPLNEDSGNHDGRKENVGRGEEFPEGLKQDAVVVISGVRIRGSGRCEIKVLSIKGNKPSGDQPGL